MACRDTNTITNNGPRLWFGVDSTVRSDILLQNNISEFEWVTRNKVYPCFWGRYIIGDNCLTKEEIDFLRRKACKIALIHRTSNEKMTEEQGITEAEIIIARVKELEISEGVALYLEIESDEDVSVEYMCKYAEKIMSAGYIPGFKANTDANYDFDREFSRAMQINKDLMSNCLVWTISPSLEEYDGITTTHLISPDNWKPFAPSGLTRDDIAIWQYGLNCHPISDEDGNRVTFNVDLMIDRELMINTMV